MWLLPSYTHTITTHKYKYTPLVPSGKINFTGSHSELWFPGAPHALCRRRPTRTFPSRTNPCKVTSTNSFHHSLSQEHPPHVSLSHNLKTTLTCRLTHCAKITLLHKGYCSNVLTSTSWHEMRTARLTKHVCKISKEKRTGTASRKQRSASCVTACHATRASAEAGRFYFSLHFLCCSPCECVNCCVCGFGNCVK